MFETDSFKVTFFDAASIVDDFDRCGAKVSKANLDGSGAGIDGVLQKFLQRRAEIQDDLVGENGGNMTVSGQPPSLHSGLNLNDMDAFISLFIINLFLMSKGASE